MTPKPKYQMKLNLSILKHLGIGLYSNSVAVITEAVANAWDADATSVTIDVKNNPKSIEIIDNGTGMSLDDVNERFLEVGYDRRNDSKRLDAAKTLDGRRVMGRKGLGKLSLFSIAQTVDIYTKKKGQAAQAFRLDVKDIEKAIASGPGVYNPHELDLTAFMAPANLVGTMIRLSNLKATRLVSATQLKQRLARRFAVIGPLQKFEVNVDGSPISTNDRNYFSKLQYIWIFGSDKYVASLKVQLANYSNIKRTETLNETIGNDGYIVEGWIGTSKEPGDLATDKLNAETENLNSIILLARGRPIQENILGQINDGRIYTKYLVGEVNADFLDSDHLEDIATSSRQSIIEDDPRYIALKKFILDRLSSIAGDWSEFRTADGGKEALTDLPILKQWIETLGSPDNKKSAIRLIARIQSLPIDKPEDRSELFKHGILAFERLRMKQNLSALDNLETFDSAQFRLIVEDVDQIEQTLYLEVIKERLSIIEKLKTLKDINALEKEIQQLVFDKLWLIDPSWERGTDALTMEETLGKTFKTATHLSVEESKARLDIRYKRSANSHIIIELKRAERKDLTYRNLYDQGAKYVSGLRKGLISDAIPDPHIQVVFLLGAAPKVDLPTDKELFRLIDARYLTYNQLVTNASTMYRQYLEEKGKLDPLRVVIEALSSPFPTDAIDKITETASSKATKDKTSLSTSRITKKTALKKIIKKGNFKKRR
jgi:Histidine kinase-, DNA gyrase B-, and HSP90-like ATPase